MTKFNWSGANERERFLKACFRGDDLKEYKSDPQNERIIDLDNLDQNPLQLIDDDFAGIMPNEEKRKRIYNFIVKNNPKIISSDRLASKCNQLIISSKEFYDLCWHIFMIDNPKDIQRALPIMACQSIVFLNIYNTVYSKKGNKAKRLTAEIWLEIKNRNIEVTSWEKSD